MKSVRSGTGSATLQNGRLMARRVVYQQRCMWAEEGRNGELRLAAFLSYGPLTKILDTTVSVLLNG